MKINKSFIYPILVICSFFICEPLFAQLPQISEKKNSKGRKQYALKLITSFKKIDDCIPTLSPSRTEWLQSELRAYEKTKNIKRWLELSRSREYLLNSVKTHTESLLQNLTSITETRQIKMEMRLWCLVVEDLLSGGYWGDLLSLIEIGVVDRKLVVDASIMTELNQHSLEANNGTIPSWLIIKNIIRPYLENSLSD